MQNEIPSVKELVSQYDSTAKRTIITLILELIISVYLISKINWEIVRSEIFLISLLILTVLGNLSLGLLELVVMRKKEASDLSGKVGNYDKDTLNNLIKEVYRLLGKNIANINVFITRDRSLNAAAIKITKTNLFSSLNAIYLNKPALYLLNHDELKYLVGHELGHLISYPNLFKNYYFIHTIFVTLVATYSYCNIPIYGDVKIIIALIICGLSYKILQLLGEHDSYVQEFLADYCGLVVSNKVSSLKAILKIGIRSEAEQSCYKYCLKQSANGKLSLKQVNQIMDKVLPFDSLTLNNYENLINKEIQSLSIKNNNISLLGFIRYIFHQDTIDINENKKEFLIENQKLDILKLIEWDRNNIEQMQKEDLDIIVKKVEADPHALLFKFKGEDTTGSDSHPSFRSRLLFLFNAQTAPKSQ